MDGFTIHKMNGERGHNKEPWKARKAGGFIQLLGTACDEAHGTDHPAPSREKVPGHGRCPGATSDFWEVAFAPVLQNFNAHIYKLKIISTLCSCPKGAVCKFLSKKGILKA